MWPGGGACHHLGPPIQTGRQPRPRAQYLGCIDGLLVGTVTEQRHPELSGDVAKRRDLVGAGATGEQVALGGVVQLLQCEEAQTLDKCTFHLQGRQTPWTHCLPTPQGQVLLPPRAPGHPEWGLE